MARMSFTVAETGDEADGLDVVWRSAQKTSCGRGRAGPVHCPWHQCCAHPRSAALGTRWRTRAGHPSRRSRLRLPEPCRLCFAWVAVLSCVRFMPVTFSHLNWSDRDLYRASALDGLADHRCGDELWRRRTGAWRLLLLVDWGALTLRSGPGGRLYAAHRDGRRRHGVLTGLGGDFMAAPRPR